MEMDDQYNVLSFSALLLLVNLNLLLQVSRWRWNCWTVVFGYCLEVGYSYSKSWLQGDGTLSDNWFGFRGAAEHDLVSANKEGEKALLVIEVVAFNDRNQSSGWLEMRNVDEAKLIMDAPMSDEYHVVGQVKKSDQYQPVWLWGVADLI
ncbi:hypothetical protein Ancab_023149 [Ancistrocladus abbreviatus]